MEQVRVVHNNIFHQLVYSLFKIHFHEDILYYHATSGKYFHSLFLIFTQLVGLQADGKKTSYITGQWVGVFLSDRCDGGGIITVGGELCLPLS